ncbi:hypothetical protein [Streptomyces sp. NPDC059278]|uniref:hypothetical protein n=1 Tax=Streptomyces sp. NPDC059278 TaxID=3346801 RepID=UPI003685B000
MSDTNHERPDTETAIACVPWLLELANHAKEGADPGLELAVPDAIKESGHIPSGARTAEDGTLVITLHDALAALDLEDLLLHFHEEEEGHGPGVEFVTPIVALAMANTTDAAHWGQTYDPDRIHELATTLTLGNWVVNVDDPIRVDEQGRIVSGLNELLAIVAANIDAPVSITYAYDDAPRPLTWRGPAGAERNHDHD